MTMIAVEPGGRFTEIPRNAVSGPPEPDEAPGAAAGAELGIAGLFDIAGRLDVTLGRLAAHLDSQATRRRRPDMPPEAVTKLHIPATPIPLTAGAGTLDVPQLFKPTLGRYWDIRSLNATGFTAGTVTVLINLIPGDLDFPFPAAGQGTFGKGENLIGPTERLTFQATGITGTVLISVRGAVVLEEWLAEYLR